MGPYLGSLGGFSLNPIVPFSRGILSTFLPNISIYHLSPSLWIYQSQTYIAFFHMWKDIQNSMLKNKLTGDGEVNWKALKSLSLSKRGCVYTAEVDQSREGPQTTLPPADPASGPLTRNLALAVPLLECSPLGSSSLLASYRAWLMERKWGRVTAKEEQEGPTVSSNKCFHKRQSHDFLF